MSPFSQRSHRRRNYGYLLFSPVSFVPVHLDSVSNCRRILVRHARVMQVASLQVWAPLLWGPSFLLEVRPRSYRATCSRLEELQQPARPATQTRQREAEFHARNAMQTKRPRPPISPRKTPSQSHRDGTAHASNRLRSQTAAPPRRPSEAIRSPRRPS